MVKARAANRIEAVYEHWKPLSDDEFALSMTDFREFCKNSIVLDENGTPVTFILNNAQEIVAEQILKALDPIMKKVPCPSIKVLIHKSRQMGITTIFLKLEQYFMTKTKNLNALHIMPTEEECDELKDRKLIPLLQGTHPDLMANMTSTANYVDFNEFEGNILDNRLRYMPSGTRGSGHGRCHPKDDTLPTNRGIITFGDLKVGDYVYGRNGKLTPVVDIYERGEQQLYSVKLQTGQTIEVGLDHRFLVKKKVSESVVETKDIMQRLREGKKTYLPIPDAIEGAYQDVGIDYYTLGALLGDGWLGSRIRLSSKDYEMTSLGSSYCVDKRNGVLNITLSNSLKKPLKSLGLLGTHSYDKFIPEKLLFSSIEQRKALLAGLLDTDGSYSDKAKQIEFDTVSEQLALDVQKLVRSLGGKASISTRKSPKYGKHGFTGRTQFRVMINVGFNPFRLTRKHDAWICPQKTRWTKVISVTPTRTHDSVCIRVASDDHTYIGGKDWVVTHNTIHLLVEDEYAKYPDPFTLESGILPAMKGNTARIVLFTAKGMNHAYDLSKEAQREDNSWVYIFLPWYIMDEYEMEPYGKYKTMEGLSDYDYFLFSEFKKAKIPPEKWLRKAAWYDYIWREDAKRDWKYMFENYPTVAEESFRASGSPIFDAIKVNEWRERSFKRVDVFTTNGETDFRYVDDGTIKELEQPIRGHTYVMGVDPADGEIKGDDSALVVWDVSNDRVRAVCAWNGTISQNDFAELIADVANRYNEALVVPERNTGQLMIKWLTEVCQYTNIYTDAQKVSGYNNLGVYTSPGVKNEMIARLKFLIANGYYEDFDPTFCEQANYFTYEKTPSGMYRAAATAGHHDDTVMCRCVATMALDMDRFAGYNQQIVREGRKY